MLILGASLGGPGYYHGCVGEVAGAFERGHHKCLAAIGLLAAVEQVQGFDNPAALLVIFEGDGLPVEVGLGVVGCVLPIRNGDAPEIFTGGAKFVHVALGEHGHPGGGGEQTKGGTPAKVHFHGGGRGRSILNPSTEAGLRTFVESTKHQAVVASSAFNGHGCLVESSAGGAAAVVDTAEMCEFRDAEVTRDIDFVVVLYGEEHHAIDLFRAQPGILDRRVAAFNGQAKRAAARVFGEISRADSNNSCFSCEPHGHVLVLSIPIKRRRETSRTSR